MENLLNLRLAFAALFLFLTCGTSVHAQCPGRDDGFKGLFGLCGGAGQRACANLPSCNSPCSFDGASARCQPPACPAPGTPGRNDGLCFSLGPCGGPGQRSCANQPFCIAPATFDSASAKCQNQATCPPPGTPGRNDGNCFTLGACGGPGQRSCANQPFCVSPATFDSASAKCQDQSTCPARGVAGRNDGNCFTLGPCGAPGQRSCANLPFCVDGAAFDTASAKCQTLKTCTVQGVLGRDDGLCSSSGPCGYPGQRSCQNFPNCVAPATFDAATGLCQDQNKCPANYQLGRNDGLCFASASPCGGPGYRACGTAPSCSPNLNFDALTLRSGLPTCQPNKTSCPANLGPGSNDVTFFVATDLHFGKETFASASQAKQVSVMNSLGASSTPWPSTFTFAVNQSQNGSGAFAGRNLPLSVPRGVVTTGDITHYGQVEELGSFRAFYEMGNGFPGSIQFPVYVGLGNHDVDGTCSQPTGPSSCAQRMFDYVESRMKGCGSVTDFDSGSRSFAWDWGQVHLVQLHKWAGDTIFGGASDNGTNAPARHPNALQWLETNLRNSVGDSGRPVVLFQHYGWDPFSLGKLTGSPWWSLNDQNTFLNIIKDYNVVAIFTGHGHLGPSGLYTVTFKDSKGNQKTIWDFSGTTGGEGATTNQGTDLTANPEGGFFAVHITPSFMDVAQWQWTSANGGVPVIKPFGASCSRMVAGVDVTSSVKLTWDGFKFDSKAGRFLQSVGILNTGTKPIRGPLALVLDAISSNATLVNATAKVDCSPFASPYVDVQVPGDILAPGQSTSATLQFTSTDNKQIVYVSHVFGTF